MKYPDVKLGLVEAVRNKIGGEDAVDRFLRGELVISEAGSASKPKPRPNPLLAHVGMTKTPASTAPFSVRDFVDRFRQSGGKLFLWNNFSSWMLDKVYPPSGASTLACKKLLRRSVDGPIIKKLGGALKAQCTLAEFLPLLEAQRHGEAGLLLTNGWENICYVEDELRLPEDEQVAYTNEAGEKRVLRAVNVNCRADDAEWILDANSVLFSSEWNDGNQLFSRGSREPVAA